MRCGRCREVGHNAGHCPTRPDATVRIEAPGDYAETLLHERLRPLIRPCVSAPNMLESLMLSCYLQGAMDARRPEVEQAMRAEDGA